MWRMEYHKAGFFDVQRSFVSIYYWLTFSNSTFKLVSRSRMLEPLRSRFVKRWNSKILEHLGISFMYEISTKQRDKLSSVT